ncbi:MAG TPA: hypothetical protein VE913_18680 [Longimicrobium sp.]|nr:hypothetical protein [Longimicrobium sp.]
MTEPIRFLAPRLVGERFQSGAIPLEVLRDLAVLDEFRSLHAEWLDGKGVAPSATGLDWLSRAFATYYPDDLPLPYLYPTAEGGVQAEWSLGSHEITLDISIDEHRAEWHSLALEADREEESDVDLDVAAEWERFAGEIRRLAGAETP